MFNSSGQNKAPHVYAPKPINRTIPSKINLTNSFSKSRSVLSRKSAKFNHSDAKKPLTLDFISLKEIEEDFIHITSSLADSDSTEEILSILNNRNTSNTFTSIDLFKELNQKECSHIERSPNPFAKSI